MVFYPFILPFAFAFASGITDISQAYSLRLHCTVYLFRGGYFTPHRTDIKEKVGQTFLFGFYRERLGFLSALVKVCP